MRVLVTGAGGLLAGAIIRRFEADGQVVALDRRALDITDRGACESAVAAVRPDAVINCAAYNNVDAAEDDAPNAIRVNALAVRGLAECARAAAFVHFSTDFVFDGEAGRPYTEADGPNPRGAYAASKLLGEWFALEHPSAYVLRVESLFGSAGPSARAGSLQSIVRGILAERPVRVFVDRTVSPAYTADVADATHGLIARGLEPGLYHCVNAGAATWAEIAAEAARLLDRPLQVQPITLETAGLRASRPRYCALSAEKLARAGLSMPGWQDALRRHLQAVSATPPGA
jgi:dTDP-4-dehydrorhamnose reductase